MLLKISATCRCPCRVLNNPFHDPMHSKMLMQLLHKISVFESNCLGPHSCPVGKHNCDNVKQEVWWKNPGRAQEKFVPLKIQNKTKVSRGMTGELGYGLCYLHCYKAGNKSSVLPVSELKHFSCIKKCMFLVSWFLETRVPGEPPHHTHTNTLSARYICSQKMILSFNFFFHCLFGDPLMVSNNETKLDSKE